MINSIHNLKIGHTKLLTNCLNETNTVICRGESVVTSRSAVIYTFTCTKDTKEPELQHRSRGLIAFHHLPWKTHRAAWCVRACRPSFDLACIRQYHVFQAHPPPQVLIWIYNPEKIAAMPAAWTPPCSSDRANCFTGATHAPPHHEHLLPQRQAGNK